MTEVDVETKISNFWMEKCKTIDIEDEQKLAEIIEETVKREFSNPTAENPVSAFEMAGWLDPEPLKGFFKKLYKKFSTVEERLGPRIRFFVAMCLSRAPTVKDARRKMIAGRYTKVLGFSKAPTYEIVREFANEIIGTVRYPAFFDFLLKEIIRQAKLRCIVLGRRVGHDATDTTSLKYDKDAKYSGYYEKAGYKVDVVHDLDDKSVPLHYIPMELTDVEGKNLILVQQHLQSIGCPIEEHKVDGGYPSYKNIAYSETHGTSLIYKIQDGWVYNDAGNENNVKRVYQKYHTHEDFRPGADLPFMLRYLCEKGEDEVVGAYYRNLRMEYAEKHPDEFKKETGERSNKTEGFFSVMKGTTLLDGRPRKRGWREFVRRCGLTMLACVFAALIRIQHGITKNLGRLTYIT